MAQQTVVTYFDDIDQTTEGVETVRFGYNGTDYEIDLGEENRGIMADRFGEFIQYARRTGRATATNSPGAPRRRRDRGESGSIRTWAQEQGIPVSARGRIPAEVVAQYNAAH